MAVKVRIQIHTKHSKVVSLCSLETLSQGHTQSLCLGFGKHAVLLSKPSSTLQGRDIYRPLFNEGFPTEGGHPPVRLFVYEYVSFHQLT